MSSKDFELVTVKISNGTKVSLITYQARDISQLQFGFASALVNSTEYSPKTLPTYISCINKYIRFLYETEDISHLTIDQSLLLAGVYQVNNFLVGMRDDNYSGDYIVTVDAALKTFYNWINVNKAHYTHCVEEFKSPYHDNLSKANRAYSRRVSHLTMEEFVTFLKEGIKDENLKCALHFMYDTGVRISELLRFKVSDFKNLNYQEPKWIEVNVNGAKGRGGVIQEGTILISSFALMRVFDLIKRNALSDDDFVFVDKQGSPMKQNSIQRHINRVSKQMFGTGKLSKKVTAHMLRHSTAFSILLFSEGPNTLENLIQVKQILRHKSLLSVQIYTSFHYIHIVEARKDAVAAGLVTRLHEAKMIYESTFNLN